MGDCFSSEYDNIPVDGLQQPLALIQGPDGYIYDPAVAHTFMMRDKMFSWSGNDASVKDMHGNKWFQIDSRVFSMHDKCTLIDARGNELAGYRKRLMATRRTAHITIERNGQTLAVATIRQQSHFQNQHNADADIYIYPTPQDVEGSVSYSGMTPSITVDGSTLRRTKKYNFMCGRTKIAHARRKNTHMTSSRDTYFLKVGFNVDIAFLTMCTLAMDELFVAKK